MTDEYRINPDTGIIVKDIGNLSGAFFQIPWRAATQEEIDADLSATAKTAKIQVLKTDRDTFLDAGYLYPGPIFFPAWSDSETYSKNAWVTSASVNYRSLADDNLNNDPPSSSDWWNVFFPVFRMDPSTLLNVDAKCRLNSGWADAFKFYEKSDSSGYRCQIDFGDAGNWTLFVEAFLAEEDRVMVKYNDYRNQIADCVTIAEVNAIIINFDE